MDSFYYNLKGLNLMGEINMYYERYRANTEIWNGIPTLNLGAITIRPFYLNQIETEAKFLLINNNDELVRRYLPSMFVENEEQAMSILEDFILRFQVKRSILFCITNTQSAIPYGYIICDSPEAFNPATKKAMGDWSISFLIKSDLRKQGIVYKCVANVLTYLQKMEVPRVYFFVDKANTASINLLTTKIKAIQVDVIHPTLKFGIRLRRDVEL